MDISGIPVEIRHEKGQFKFGRSGDGRGWMTRMHAHDGIVRGLDGQGRHQVKAWVGDDPDAKTAYLLEQQHPDGAHDEEKLVLGFKDPVSAVQTLMKHYPKDGHPITSIRQLPDLEDWIAEGECWAETAHQHHSRPHEHRDPCVMLDGKRLPADPIDLDLGEEITKANEPVQDGDRWITVHPNGPGSKGNAVLLRPVKGQPGVHRVVGGAGGKLNFLKITLTKDPAQYKQEAMERQKAKRADEKAALAKMSPEERTAHQQKEVLRKAARVKAESDFIRSVLGDDQGGETPDLFQEGPEADPNAVKAYHRERLKQALGACKEAERRLVLDADARVAAGMTQVGAQVTPGLMIDQILSTPSTGGPGYDRAIKARAAVNGMTGDKILAAANDWKEANGMLPKNPTAPGAPTADTATAAGEAAYLETKALQAAKAAATAQAIHEALANNEKLGAFLKARSELREAYEQAIAAKTGRTFLPGFLATVSEASPEDQARIVDDLTEQLVRSHVSNFLDEAEQNNPDSENIDLTSPEEDGIAAPRGAAAWACLHEASFAIFGQGLLDRDTVETLGGEASAQVLARAIRNKFNPAEQDEILTALEGQHLQEQQTDLPQATEEAQRLRSEAQIAKEQMLSTPRDFAAAAELHRTRLAALKQAQTVLGGALGRFEARAALIASLQSAPAKNLQVPIGRATPEKAIAAASAMGLMPGDYQMDQSGGEAILTIPEVGQDKLIRPVDSGEAAERELALSIKRGDLDEDNYLPNGFAQRSTTRYENQMMEPPVFQRRVELPEGANASHLEGALRRYVGQRWADGERPTAILADLRGAALRDDIPEGLHGDLAGVVDRITPLYETVKGADGEPIQEMHDGHAVVDTNGQPVFKTRMRAPKDIADTIEGLGKHYLSSEQEGDLTLEGQHVNQDHPDFREAIHRVLADDPRLQAAHAPVGELTGVQQAGIRDWFYREHHAKRGDQLADAIQAIGPEPPKFDESTGGMSLFEDLGPVESPEWVAWTQKKTAAMEKFSDKGSPWAGYIDAMGGLKPATEALQGEMRGRFAEAFHDHYSRLTGQKLQMGTQDIEHYSNHLKATTDPEKAAELESTRKAKQAQMQKAGGGRFTSVKTKEKAEQAGQAALFSQGGSLFGADELGDEPQVETPKWEKPEAAPGERMTLGQRLEAQIAAVMPEASEPFQDKSFKSTKIREGMKMSGRFAAQQRGVKGFAKLKRMGMFYGAGSGKSAVMLGGASEIIHSGAAKKVMMAVPSIVQGQFGSEAVNMLDPTTGIKVHAKPGESYEERLAAYRDPELHACVVTHQALRDDSIKLMAQHQNKTEDEISKWAMTADPQELCQGLAAAFTSAGADFQGLMVDEGHDALNRKGKPDSLLAKILDAHSANATHYLPATGTPIKNDPSEAFDWLHKLAPDRYPMTAQAEFLRRYGDNTAVTRRALKAELGRYFFTDRVGSGVTAHHHDQTVPLSAEQNSDIDRITRASAKLQLGEDPIKWAKELAPQAFDGKPESEHGQIADGIRRAVGTFRESAMDKAINAHPQGGKLAAAVKLAQDHVAEGKPAVIFCHRLDAVEHTLAAMEKAGLRVVGLTGKDSAKDKATKIGRFQGGPGRQPDADVIVMSDAGATGANLQRGKLLVHMDQPMTQKTWEQRTARIDRLGQTSDVDVVNLLADHEWDRKARERVGRKKLLADIYQSKDGNFDDSGLAQSLRDLRSRTLAAQAAA
jgi:hypothetical protein